MKKILSLCMLLIMAVSTQVTAADNPDSNREQTKQQLDREIQKHVFYPILSAAKANATVDVILRISDAGTLEVVSASSSNEEIRQFVEKQLQQITLDKDAVQKGEVFRYRFTFKRQA